MATKVTKRMCVGALTTIWLLARIPLAVCVSMTLLGCEIIEDTRSAGALFSTEPIDFGLSICGGTAPADTFLTISNTAEIALAYEASLGATNEFSLVGQTSGSIAPGASAHVTIAAAAIPASAMAGAVHTVTLTLDTSDPARRTTHIPVRITPAGGTLELDPMSAEFGTVPLGVRAADVPLSLTNTGNMAVSLVFVQPGDAQFALAYTSSPGAVTLLPGANVPGLVALFEAAVTTASTTTAGISTTSPLCGVGASRIFMTGQGAEVPIDVSTGAGGGGSTSGR